MSLLWLPLTHTKIRPNARPVYRPGRNILNPPLTSTYIYCGKYTIIGHEKHLNILKLSLVKPIYPVASGHAKCSAAVGTSSRMNILPQALMKRTIPEYTNICHVDNPIDTSSKYNCTGESQFEL